MLIQPIDVFVHVWLIVAVLSAAYVAWDQFTGNPEPKVMKWGFVLVTLYMGPIGLLLYVMADKEPKPGSHEEFIKPLWKQGVGSTVHCVAGDATGIILAAVVVALIGLPMWLDLIIEYVAGFLFGLLIFQALFMRKMMGGSYLENLRRSFLPEFISMNCMMAGMAPVMAFLMMGRDMRAMWPGEPLFWMVMSLGVIVGFLIAYPVNVWLVARGMKHGLMTERAAGEAPARAHAHARGTTKAMTSKATKHAGAKGKSHAHQHAGKAHAQAGSADMKPVHPLLVHFPIALLMLSVVADASAFFGAPASLRAAGWWALLGAAVMSLLTVLTGLYDMRRAMMSEATHQRVHRHRAVGLTLAGAIIGLTVWRWTLGGDAATVGIGYLTLAGLTVVLTAFQGWLGGELVFTHGVGVRPAMEQVATSSDAHGAAAHDHENSHRPRAETQPEAGGASPMDHAAMKQPTSAAGGGGGMVRDVTGPQLAAVTLFTALMLLAGMTVPAAFVNLRLTAHEVGGLVMPPGMIMTQETPADAMRDMAAVDPRLVTARYGIDVRGDRPLVPRLENGVKVFDLETSIIRWQILPKVYVDAFAYNGQVPGPRLRFEQGDRVRINLTNRLPDTTTTHWHGLVLPNVMDGPARVTQAPIENGHMYRYEFTAVQAGTFFYHSHDHVDRQQSLGLYGAMIIDPPQLDPSLEADHELTIQLQEWLIRDGLTYPAMPMDGGMPNYFTINGRAYPATDNVHMEVGETLKVRFIGSSTGFIHPMHIHGGPFVVVARDGVTLAPNQRFEADTVNVGPGQRYDVIWTARKPGIWMIHCHIPHHTTNNNTETQGGGGLMMHIMVAGDPTT